MVTLKWLWILVIAFCVLEWISIPFISAFTGKLYQVVDGVLIITFIIYPLFFLTTLLLLQKGIKNWCSNFAYSTSCVCPRVNKSSNVG